MQDISAIILTKDEEIHIARALDNLKDFVREIFIIDSFSSDRTLEIARRYDNVTILQNKWTNYATQFNWALDNAPISGKWVLRIDADEYLLPELKEEIAEKLPSVGDNVSGATFRLLRVFMGREIRRGMPAIRLLRLFRYGKARSEVRQMDEHISVSEGEIMDFDGEFADDNLNNLSWWTQKHVGYAIREAADLLDMEYGLTANTGEGNVNLNAQAQAKRHKKTKYARLPLFWRSFAYFCYRYFIRLGFLEGKEGFLWHFLQGWWYRTLVDAKVYEIKKACGSNPEKITEYLKTTYNVDMHKHADRGGVIYCNSMIWMEGRAA